MNKSIIRDIDETFMSLKYDEKGNRYYLVHASLFIGCGFYSFTIYPINGWDRNGGIGKPSSTIYHHRISNIYFVTDNLSVCLIYYFI